MLPALFCRPSENDRQDGGYHDNVCFHEQPRGKRIPVDVQGNSAITRFASSTRGMPKNPQMGIPGVIQIDVGITHSMPHLRRGRPDGFLCPGDDLSGWDITFKTSLAKRKTLSIPLSGSTGSGESTAEMDQKVRDITIGLITPPGGNH